MKYSNDRWMTFFAAVAVVALVTAGFPAGVQAQTTILRVSLPFEFHIGNKVLPPGTYMVRQFGTGGALVVSDGNGHSGTALTNATHRPSARNSAESVLVFNVYGNRYFLDEVRWAGYMQGRTLLKSRFEIEIAKAVTEGKPTTESVAAK